MFRLNTSLPIAFGSHERMEVELLAEGLRLVIEIDGVQHLGNPAAYRRDRPKDILLQENGYRVLRFLGEDLSRDLDAIHRAVVCLGRRTDHAVRFGDG